MPKSEDLAFYSFCLSTATLLALRRRYHWAPLTRTRIIGGFTLFAGWQRYLASGGWTWHIASNHYVPTPNPDDEHRGMGQQPHWNNVTYKGIDSMWGKNVLVTGVGSSAPGTSKGIGFYTAVGAYRMGANVIVTSRDADPEKRLQLAQEIQWAANVHRCMDGVTTMEERIHVVELDYSKDLLDTVKNCVKQLDDMKISYVDVLINNAGAYFELGPEHKPRFHQYNTGVELTTATNVIGPMLLTEALKPRIPLGGRIVHVASSAHTQIKDAGATQLSGLIHGRAVSRAAFDYYAASKFCNIAYAGNQNRVDDQHVHVAVHPGVAITGLFRNVASMKFFNEYGLSAWLEGLTLLVCKSPKEASFTSLHAASDPFVTSQVREQGVLYYVDCAPGNKYLSPLAKSEAAQDQCVKELNEIVQSIKERKKKLDARASA